MTERKLKNYTDVLLGKARIVRAKTKPTPAEQVVNQLVARNRAALANMSASQKRAAILRGCC